MSFNNETNCNPEEKKAKNGILLYQVGGLAHQLCI
jgi:hypothetical protein